MTPSEEWDRLTLLEKLRKLEPGMFQPGLYAAAADEIERLRERLDAEGVEIERLCGEAETIPRWVRNAALEEAAQVAETYKAVAGQINVETCIAAAIRALKALKETL